MAARKRILASLDSETDPFERGQIVKPFCWGFYSDNGYIDFWGDDCTERFIAWLSEQTIPYLIYAHNGGKFDYLFLLQYLVDTTPKIINGRIVSWKFGIHEFRDSYSILPVPLKQSGEKKEIDYKKMKAGVRWRHKKEILDYLYQDCVALYNMVAAFKENLGNGLTMAGTATRLLKAATPEKLEQLTLEQDKEMRQFFFGGRVQCFEKGIIRDNLIISDLRSAYPDAMRNKLHPVGNKYILQKDIDLDTDFAEIDATSYGAFPFRTKEGLEFPNCRAVFRVTGHELRAAIELGLVTIHRVIRAISFLRKTSFVDFVDTYTALRKQAADNGDEIGKLHYKLVQNSSYGRFALNPERLYSWLVTDCNQKPSNEWEPAFSGGEAIFWRKPIDESEKRRAISNVATGASITGATRAKLLYAIHGAERPIYCDTDSIISRTLCSVPDDGTLGKWVLEAAGHKIAVAAKKLYAMFGEPANDDKLRIKRIKEYGDERCVKLASKGVRLTAAEIVRVCEGETIKWLAQSPTMALDGTQNYMHRTVKMRA
jgi:hypothetical protein